MKQFSPPRNAHKSHDLHTKLAVDASRFCGMIHCNGRAIFHEKRAERSPYGIRNRDFEGFGRPKAPESRKGKSRGVGQLVPRDGSATKVRQTGRPGGSDRWTRIPGISGNRNPRKLRETGASGGLGQPRFWKEPGDRIFSERGVKARAAEAAFRAAREARVQARTA